jgi:hypothetical protein
VVSSALELMEGDRRALLADRVEHLRRAGLGRRQLDRRFAEVPQAPREDISQVRYFAYIQVAPEEQNLWLEYAQLALSQPHSR